MKKGKIRKLFIPSTKLGKISLWLFAGFILFIFIANMFVMSGQTGGETFFDNLWISVPMFSAAICAIASFFTGIISIIRKKERAILVYISTLIGLLILWFIVGEIVMPH